MPDFKTLRQLSLLLILLFACHLPGARAQSDDDVNDAFFYAKKFKTDGVLCSLSKQVFSFGKGKNSLGDKVIAIEEESQYDFLALQNYSSMMFPEFYNKFVELRMFKRSFKYGNKFVTSGKAGIDRSVTDDGIFFDDSRMQFYPLRFYKQGNVARIEVKKLYTDSKYLTRLYFSSPYPTKECSFEFRVPDGLSVEFKRMNFEGKKIEVTENKKGGITSYVFTMRDVPGYKQEYMRIDRAYTEPHIVLQVKSYEYKGEVYKGFDNTADVYAWNNRLYQMAQNDKDVVKKALPGIIKNAKTDLEKIKAIYYWVQDNNRYIAYEDGYSGFIPATVQEVYSKKYGDCKGMANLLTELLKAAGYDARFTWIGTRSIPYTQATPALCVNNHAITTLYFGGKTYFLDGTEKFAPFGENAFRIQGKEAMVANGDKFEIVKVPSSTAEENAISTKADFTLNKDVLTGNVKVTLTGVHRTQFHQEYQNIPSGKQEEFLNDYLEFNNDNLTATNLKTDDLKNRDIPISIEGNVDLSNTVSTISGNKYVSVDFFPKSLEKFIPDEKRIEGYDLDEIVKFDDQITLTIPADKKFIDKPDDLTIRHDGYEFTGTYTIAGNKITLSKSLMIKNNIIKKSEFPQWIKFINAIKEFNKYLITISNK